MLERDDSDAIPLFQDSLGQSNAQYDQRIETKHASQKQGKPDVHSFDELELNRVVGEEVLENEQATPYQEDETLEYHHGDTVNGDRARFVAKL